MGEGPQECAVFHKKPRRSRQNFTKISALAIELERRWKMKRREFLKTIGGGAVALVLPMPSSPQPSSIGHTSTRDKLAQIHNCIRKFRSQQNGWPSRVIAQDEYRQIVLDWTHRNTDKTKSPLTAVESAHIERLLHQDVNPKRPRVFLEGIDGVLLHFFTGKQHPYTAWLIFK